MNRQEIWRQLNQQFDILIIGGGITGVGTARDAAYRGLKVAVIEMNDLAFGTSSRSSKLVHGGLRYLETYEFSLVFEAVSERRILMNIAPHLVNPLGFLFPIYKNSRRSSFTVNLGMWVYDGLSLFRSPKIHRNLSKKEVQKEEPALLSHDIKGAPLYYDCSTDDARLTLETALDAVKHDALVATYTKVIGYVYENNHIVGVRVRDQFSGEEKEVRANAVINATGPWSDKTRLLGEEGKERLRPTKGVHIVFDGKKLPLNNAVVCFHPVDGRVLFVIPWGDRSYVGTTDTDFTEKLGEVAATKEDVAYLLEATNHYFPDVNLKTDDVISTWAGVRPLLAGEAGEDESAVSREHVISIDKNGLVTIAGGKLTTYRRMAAEVVDKTIDWLRLKDKLPNLKKQKDTAIEALPGGVGWPANDDHDAVIQQFLDGAKEKNIRNISRETASLLVNTYGMCAFDILKIMEENPELAEPLCSDRPEVLAQVYHAVKEELALSVSDVLIRRTQIFYRDFNQGLDCVEKVADLMAAMFGWSEKVKQKEVDAYQTEVARSRQWQNA